MGTPTQATVTYSCQAAKPDLLGYGKQAVQRGIINVKTASSASWKKSLCCELKWVRRWN